MVTPAPAVDANPALAPKLKLLGLPRPTACFNRDDHSGALRFSRKSTLMNANRSGTVDYGELISTHLR